ncbi:MAG: hypothetical protein ASARMPRED_004553 [Alectoria sarmentosa]|nr:MAG: hypothetical protein ASARMPRED_004553 [Alectoria sarmentosa]
MRIPTSPRTILLDSVGFSNAVCFEHSVGSDAAESVLVVIGLSKKGDLFYFVGQRQLVDVLRNSDQVHDLSRDVAKGLWNETSLVVQTVGKTPEVVEYTAFTTAITLSNAQSYPVNIFSKDSPIALVQNRTHRLGNKAEEFLTDSSGCVAVVIPVSNNAISCSKLDVKTPAVLPAQPEDATENDHAAEVIIDD